MEATNIKKPMIFAVDDEADILELIAIHAQKASFHIKTFSRAEPLLKTLIGEIPDLIILDLMLPDLDGLEICKRLKKDERTAAIPILILTAKGDETDVVLGLELGADDYMVKPFSPKELVARIHAILRRRKAPGAASSGQWRIGDMLEIDERQHAVWVAGRKLELTATEFSILKVLARNPGWVFSREQLLDKVWGEDKASLDRTIDVHVKNLRDKLGEAGRLIKSVRGVGYKLEP
ncbi:MAG: response regulator transcription factor [Candidatus Aminicenantes bacterium]|nr:response regulator transcription factor [Candidatus Aminicenantes bacterium]